MPVPERTWALRNVANAMLRSGATAAAAADGGGGAAAEEAVGMLRQAAQLSADHYGPEHPGMVARRRQEMMFCERGHFLTHSPTH